MKWSELRDRLPNYGEDTARRIYTAMGRTPGNSSMDQLKDRIRRYANSVADQDVPAEVLAALASDGSIRSRRTRPAFNNQAPRRRSTTRSGTGTGGGSNKGSSKEEPIVPQHAPPQITTIDLYEGQSGRDHRQQLTAVDGIAPYMWEAYNLPAGLMLHSGGLLYGNPTEHGTFEVTIKLRDKEGNEDERKLLLIVKPAEVKEPEPTPVQQPVPNQAAQRPEPVEIKSRTNYQVQPGEKVNIQFQADGGPNIEWYSRDLPFWLSITGNHLEGTAPKSAHNDVFTVTARRRDDGNGNGGEDTATFRIEVCAPGNPIAVAIASVNNGTPLWSNALGALLAAAIIGFIVWAIFFKDGDNGTPSAEAQDNTPVVVTETPTGGDKAVATATPGTAVATATPVPSGSATGNPAPCRGSSSPGAPAELASIQVMATEKFGIAGHDSCNPIFWRPIPNFPGANNGAYFSGSGLTLVPANYRADIDGFTCDMSVRAKFPAWKDGIVGGEGVVVEVMGSGGTFWNIKGATTACPTN